MQLLKTKISLAGDCIATTNLNGTGQVTTYVTMSTDLDCACAQHSSYKLASKLHIFITAILSDQVDAIDPSQRAYGDITELPRTSGTLLLVYDDYQ